jgi:chemotaxis protein methyltransferase CheR
MTNPSGLLPPPSATNQSEKLSQDNYQFLQRYVLESSGIVIDLGKDYLFEARLMPLVRRENLRSLNDLCALIKATSVTPIRQEILEAMTTNETLFFRDMAPFDALKNAILPELRAKRAVAKRLRLWSAAASSGQEAYSLAMLLLENGFQDWSLKIVGTDIAESILERARSGRYSQLEVNRGLPASYLIKYFTRHGLEWQLKDEIRRMVQFERLDLRRATADPGSFDIVFCRNVLIYFDPPAKKKILSGIQLVLAPGGYLSLGAAETVINLNETLVKRVFGTATLYQNPE